MAEDGPLRADCTLLPDPSRVAGMLFLPGQETAAPGQSRAAGVVDRCLALTDAEVRQTLETVRQRFELRHRDLWGLLEDHFAELAHRVPSADRLGPERRRLLGAYFTREVAVEAAALCNPSVVVQPRHVTSSDGVRFILSARAVSEGHVSAVVFRSGTFTPRNGTGAVQLDPVSRFVGVGRAAGTTTPRNRLRPGAVEVGADPETVDFVLSRLPEDVGLTELDAAAADLGDQALTRTDLNSTLRTLQRIVAAAYDVRFPDGSDLSERMLFPVSPDESHGLEDARFVRTVDGPRALAATYTGYDGEQIVSRRLDTDDFETFSSRPLTGIGARGKGLALFPRRMGGRYLALSRWDRESNALASSADGYHWDVVHELQQPAGPWDLVQLGNCGSPLETRAGWLVLTHGVGPMRSYSIGALLLDPDDPRRVIGRLPEPLLEPHPDERDGYVPNVVYSCGALVHQDTLLIPYGVGDRSVGFCLVDLPELLARLSAR